MCPPFRVFCGLRCPAFSWISGHICPLIAGLFGAICSHFCYLLGSAIGTEPSPVRKMKAIRAPRPRPVRVSIQPAARRSATALRMLRTSLPSVSAKVSLLGLQRPVSQWANVSTRTVARSLARSARRRSARTARFQAQRLLCQSATAERVARGAVWLCFLVLRLAAFSICFPPVASTTDAPGLPFPSGGGWFAKLRFYSIFSMQALAGFASASA